MKTQYTNQLLTEIITSDGEVEQLRCKMLHAYTTKIIMYVILMILMLAVATIIELYGIKIHNETTQIIAILALLPISLIYALVQNYRIKKIFMAHATTSLVIAKRCIEFANLVDNYPDASQLSQKVQEQGRQLYNFDIGAIIDSREQQLLNIWAAQRDERNRLEKQKEDEACKKIHGLTV